MSNDKNQPTIFNENGNIDLNKLSLLIEYELKQAITNILKNEAEDIKDYIDVDALIAESIANTQPLLNTKTIKNDTNKKD